MSLSLFTSSLLCVCGAKFLRFSREFENAQDKIDQEVLAGYEIVDPSSEIVIRPMEKGDADIMIKIWVAGLSQTFMAFAWYNPLRYRMGKGLKQLKVSATEKGGDMNRESIIAEWTGKSSIGKQMYVAVAQSTKNKPVVVGLCGVSRGASQKGDDSDPLIPPNTFSLWRVSVATNARKRGIAKLLSEAAEGFARDNGGEYMRCITANPVASRLYYKLGYSLVPGQTFGFWSLIAPWLQKKL